MFDGNFALYGNKRECEQLAYVLDIKKYIILENLNNYNKNFKIIICNNDFKIKLFILKNKLKHKINYYIMKDVYKEINKDFSKDFMVSRLYAVYNRNNIIQNKTFQFWHNRPPINNIFLIKKIPVEYLYPSEMFLLTINSKQKDINCNNLEDICYCDNEGVIWGCCSYWSKIPFGNIMKDKDPYNSYLARIIKLSSLNKTFCFCNFERCQLPIINETKKEFKIFKTSKYPKEVNLAIDGTCNLKCLSCRKCYATKPKEYSNLLADKIIETGWLEKANNIIMAGNGEVFFSPIYKKMLTSDIKRKDITILSNGTLFNEKNWDLIKNKYDIIHVRISIDAATKETYKKLRCGIFDELMKNLNMLSKLRNENKIKSFQINFVVQEDNYKEINDFIKLGKKLNTDVVQLMKLNNWNIWNNEEYVRKSMVIDNKYLKKELFDILKNIHDEIVNVDPFIFFIEESKKKYKD